MQEKVMRRAKMLRAIREYFHQDAVLEVDTPIMSQFGNSDPALLNFMSTFNGPGKLYRHTTYLITSPEYHMKRLLAHQSGSIYYLGKVFRDGELSSRHTPEFTMLEWYRVNYDLFELTQEVIHLIRMLSKQHIEVVEYSYLTLFMEKLALNPFMATAAELDSVLKTQGVSLAFTPQTKDEYLDLIMSHLIEPTFDPDVITVLHSYPASQASLAKITQDCAGNAIGKRFEVYWRGLELANGYEELTDPIEQRARFEAENKVRTQYGLAPVAIDELFLQEMASMPALVSGVAMGIDRLLMAATNTHNINDVILFSFEES
ncbi:EF-P lysine aminoacylase GenX [Wohlfahrtiimonas chitiniclastica]|uniref:EF-P lysine aminoacylase EpmA n=1 Tax=Wohlfahrtiimonas chitiniclastica TaxID=400946 RepID=UPI000B998C1E|nr:EF-P lysine aminoacylase EpmA [Wohlfahrtiimonas chitiniclastica]OYQ77262.1 EF-P lysine aminoacylase GenX [Wohlfahrtiimonas chitiniclastica]